MIFFAAVQVLDIGILPAHGALASCDVLSAKEVNMPHKGGRPDAPVWLKMVAAGLAVGVFLAPTASGDSHGANVATRDPAGCVVLTIH